MMDLFPTDLEANIPHKVAECTSTSLLIKQNAQAPGNNNKIL